jgi:glycosyltransferase involved in cell wall biosynthesis
VNHKVSIVIIGRNEERGIGKCIDAALAAAVQVGGAEMIYVDSHSTDNTVSIVRSFGVKVLSLDSDLRPSPSAGRFVGTHHAKGAFVLFLDADTLVYPDFLPRALELLQAESALAGVNGHIDDLSEAGEPLSDIEERHDAIVDVKWLRGPCCFYRREALVQVGSFDPRLATEEEAELGLRLIHNGWNLKIIPQKMACHTRCYHGQSIKSIVLTFVRDIKSQRLGEITQTVAYAFRAGNGLAFCWLRLKTTIIFVAWFFAVAACFALPETLYPRTVVIAFLLLGVTAIYAKKRRLSHTLLFIPTKILNLIDLLAGVNKIKTRDTRTYPIDNMPENTGI